AIDWQDRWTDQRHGEAKHPDIYTDVAHDMLPHCWSLLKVVAPDLGGLTDVQIQYHPSKVLCAAQLGDHTKVVITLSRRAEHRRRIVTLNEGEAVVDFSDEPGWTEIQGQRHANSWGESRPLKAALLDFFQVVSRRKGVADWLFSLDQCVDAVAFAEEASRQLWLIQQRGLRQLLNRVERPADSVDGVHRVVDFYVPYAASVLGQRIPAWNTDEQRALVDGLDLPELTQLRFPGTPDSPSTPDDGSDHAG
ncbi:MAG: hypothetical protein MI861_00680, partial [Pirellulales bacterium]|nr:hypothetical protein [Pirellulales bacterium]